MITAYEFFLAYGGYCTPPGPEQCARNLAEAEKRGNDRGLQVVWENELIPWDGDCEEPNVYASASVHLDGRCLAAFGGIGLDSWRDPHMRVVEAELMVEALAVLDAESQEAADLLASRATFAGPVLT